MTSRDSPAIELIDPVSRTTSRAVDEDVERGMGGDPNSPAASDAPTAAPSQIVSEKDAPDPFEVHWDGPDDPDSPLNMSTARKW